MKTRHSKYSFALSIHLEFITKPWRLRRIPTKGVHKGMLGLNASPLSLIFYKNFITCTKEI